MNSDSDYLDPMLVKLSGILHGYTSYPGIHPVWASGDIHIIPVDKPLKAIVLHSLSACILGEKLKYSQMEETISSTSLASSSLYDLFLKVTLHCWNITRTQEGPLLFGEKLLKSKGSGSSFHIMDAATKTPEEDKPAKFETADYLERIEFIKDPNAPTNPIVNAGFTVAAHLAIAVFAAITILRGYLRQLSYLIARNTVFRHRTPQLVRQDVSQLPKIPRHVAFVLSFQRGHGDIDTLIEHSVECLNWVVGIGAPKVTLYERTGVLKTLPLDQVAAALATGLSKHITNSDMPYVVVRSGTEVAGYGMEQTDNTVIITIASEQDGRPMLVTLANEYQKEVANGQLKPEEITVEKVHDTILERVGEEPDLLVTFGSYLDVERFSPWLLRVTELFCLPDNNGVFHYMVFYRALQKFANVKVNLGA